MNSLLKHARVVAFAFALGFLVFPTWEIMPTVGGEAWACGDTYMNAGGNSAQDSDCDGTPDNTDPCPTDPSNMCKDDGRSPWCHAGTAAAVGAAALGTVYFAPVSIGISIFALGLLVYQSSSHCD